MWLIARSNPARCINLSPQYPWLLLPIKSEGGIVVIGYRTVHMYIVNCYSEPNMCSTNELKKVSILGNIPTHPSPVGVS